MKCEPSSWFGLVPVNAALPCITMTKRSPPQRPKGGVMLRVQLIHQRPENALLETWLHAGENRLPPWQGALAQAPITGQLWLVQ